MRARVFITLLVLFFSHRALPISVQESKKFINQYESFSQRVLGLLNCVSRVMTGSDAVEVPESNQKEKGAKPALVHQGPPAKTLEGCIQQAGFKTNGGFFKMVAKLGQQDELDRELSSLDTELALEERTVEERKEKRVKRKKARGEKARMITSDSPKNSPKQLSY